MRVRMYVKRTVPDKYGRPQQVVAESRWSLEQVLPVQSNRPSLGARKSGRLQQMVSHGRCMVNPAYRACIYASMYSNQRE